MRFILIAMLLTSCGLNPEYRAKVQERKMARLEETCLSLGFEKDSKDMAECKLSLYKGNPTPYTPRTQQCTTQNGVTQCHSF